VSHIEQNLIPGETLLYQTGLHWIVLVVPLGIGAIFALLALAVVAADGSGGAAFLLLTAAACVGLALLKKKSVEMGVTNKRVITKSGILSRKTLELLLTKIESIKVEEGLVGRMLGYGTVIVRGTGGTPEPFPCIAQPMEFRRQVQQQIEGTNASVPAGAR
jgi:uncharacterized membrane protein YdbT with pleckstrin-like domain